MKQPPQLRPGDRVSVCRSGHAPGTRNGGGEVLEVVGPPGQEVYRVRWPAGVETYYRPDRRELAHAVRNRVSSRGRVAR